MAARVYKKGGDPVAPPPNGRQAPVARWGATGPFFPRDLIANLKEKITLKAHPYGGATGGYF